MSIAVSNDYNICLSYFPFRYSLRLCYDHTPVARDMPHIHGHNHNASKLRHNYTASAANNAHESDVGKQDTSPTPQVSSPTHPRTHSPDSYDGHLSAMDSYGSTSSTASGSSTGTGTGYGSGSGSTQSNANNLAKDRYAPNMLQSTASGHQIQEETKRAETELKAKSNGNESNRSDTGSEELRRILDQHQRLIEQLLKDREGTNKLLQKVEKEISDLKTENQALQVIITTNQTVYLSILI